MIALLRTEYVKAFRRTRTLIVALALIGIPLLIAWAVHSDRRGGGDRGEGGLFSIARTSGLLVPAAVLEVMSVLLLVVVAGMFAGDTVASDASWGNLRYLLMRPVPRGRLLLAKVVVAATMIWACTILVALAALVGGVALFGAHPVTVPTFLGGSFGGFTLSTGTLLARLAVAVAYVAFGFSALLAIGTFFSTITDSAASAIGATIGIYVVSEVLDGIQQLRSVRYGFPTHYLSAWEPIFTENRYPKDMLVGIILQVVYLVVFGTAAFAWFKRKDIRS